jgi:hypothetical protein
MWLESFASELLDIGLLELYIYTTNPPKHDDDNNNNNNITPAMQDGGVNVEAGGAR